MNSTRSNAADLHRTSSAPQRLYQVRLAGNLDESWHEWFDDMDLEYDAQHNETLLTGAFPDRAALYGLVAKLRDLNLDLVELRRMDSK